MNILNNIGAFFSIIGPVLLKMAPIPDSFLKRSPFCFDGLLLIMVFDAFKINLEASRSQSSGMKDSPQLLQTQPNGVML